jgi:polar amino acid transport system substrate-binding protein
MLELKRIDGYAGYEVNWDYELSPMGKSGAFKKLPTFDSSQEYLVGLKSNPQVQKLLKDFDEGLRAIATNGILDKIKESWR